MYKALTALHQKRKMGGTVFFFIKTVNKFDFKCVCWKLNRSLGCY